MRCNGLALLLGLFEVGCGTHLTAVPISSQARMESGKIDGIPYYLPRPYLLLTQNFEISPDMLGQFGLVADVPDQKSTDQKSTDQKGTQSDSARVGAAKLDGPEVLAAVVPRYELKIVYLPDLARRYALQQRGGRFSNSVVEYQLEGGWMFSGTRIEQQPQSAQLIEATTSGLAGLLGGSIEHMVEAMLPLPAAGASSVGGGLPENQQPHVWLFEISEGPQGSLRINTDRPFFEWPPRDNRRSDNNHLPVLYDDRDPEAGDLRSPLRVDDRSPAGANHDATRTDAEAVPGGPHP